MQSKIALHLLFFYSLFVPAFFIFQGDDNESCEENEVYDNCGPDCEPTCRDPNPRGCDSVCVVGCRCRDGFFRNDKDECVEDCTQRSSTIKPRSCSDVIKCPSGRHCELVTKPCLHRQCPTKPAKIPECVADNMPRQQPKCSGVKCPKGTHCEIVTQTCTRKPCPQKIYRRPGCVQDRKPRPKPTCSGFRCPKGTHCELLPPRCVSYPCSTDPKPECVNNPPSRRCGKNEVYDECESGCEPNCQDPYPRVCDTFPCIARCRCRDGFFRNKKGECVSSCPPRCGKNEVYDECGSACEPSCQNPYSQECTLQCVAGCRCRNGFFRNNRGVCVSTCPPKPRPKPTCTGFRCPKGTHCELLPPPCVRFPCPRDPKPECVNNPRCGKNEMYDECGSSCEPTCKNPLLHKHSRECNLQCVPGCRCKEGFFRDNKKVCVPSCGRPGEPPECWGVYCAYGYKCEVVKPPCFTPPCPPRGVHCVARDHFPWWSFLGFHE